MSNALKRHSYLYCALSTLSFLGAFLLYELLDLGIFTDRLFFPCAVLWTTGALLAFKAIDVWSGWETDTSEDSDVRRLNPYPTTFSIMAILMMAMVVFLFVSIIIKHQPTVNETCVLAFGLVAAEICICLNRLSSRLE